MSGEQPLAAGGLLGFWPTTESRIPTAPANTCCHAPISRHADGRGRALIVGGGIANFTDVAATFKGIIQVRRTVAAWPGLAACLTASQRADCIRSAERHCRWPCLLDLLLPSRVAGCRRSGRRLTPSAPPRCASLYAEVLLLRSTAVLPFHSAGRAVAWLKHPAECSSNPLTPRLSSPAAPQVGPTTWLDWR
jgi:hypothetical protein